MARTSSGCVSRRVYSSAGWPIETPPRRKRIRLIGSTLRSRTPEEKSNILRALQRELWPLFTAGKLVTNIHAVFPIQQVNEAHGVLRRCENIGKVVLTMK